MAIGLRFFSYSLIFVAYCVFMGHQLPNGFGWADYHAYRIFNAVEYLRVNGYFSSLGFSIWSSCRDCDLQASAWEGKIYLSVPALTLWPYILLNHFFGKELFFSVGPLIDKAVIFLTGALVAELFLRQTQDSGQVFHPTPAKWWMGCVLATLFFTSAWSYQMYRAMWNDIWFLFFLLIAISLFLTLRIKTVLFFVFLASFMHPISGLIFGFVYAVFLLLSKVFDEPAAFKSFIPQSIMTPKSILILSGVAATPALILIVLRNVYTSVVNYQASGSSLLSRIGVTGDDIHNGGILGALQFLGGARITVCLASLKAPLGEIDLISKITAFNCTLSILGMALLSIFSLFGILWVLKTKESTRYFLFPILMILLCSASLLQQSFSVHLLGHSYIFAVLFACGLGGLVLKGAERIGSPSISLLVLSPAMVAVVLLSLRVSSLIGIPG